MASKAEKAYVAKHGRKPSSKKEWDEANGLAQSQYGGTKSQKQADAEDSYVRRQPDGGRGGRRPMSETAGSADMGVGSDGVPNSLRANKGASASKGTLSMKDRLAGIQAEQNMLKARAPEIPDFGGPILAALPSLADYLDPYNQAETAVRGYHDAALPQINSAYDTLKAALGQRLVEQQGRDAGVAAQLQSQLGTSQAAVNQGWDQSMASLAARGMVDGSAASGGIASAAVSEQQAAQAQLAAQFAAQQALSTGIGANNTTSGNARIADSESARTAAVANAGSNMDAALAKIGLGKADAQRQYANDLSGAQRQNAQLAQDYAAQKFQMGLDRQDALREDGRARQDAYNQSMVTGQDIIRRDAAQYQRQSPAAWEGLQSIVAAAGDDMSTALSMVDNPKAPIAGDETAKAELRKLLAMWYDQTPKYWDGQAFRQGIAEIDGGY